MEPQATSDVSLHQMQAMASSSSSCRDQAGREALGEDRTKDRGREHQDEDRVEHLIVKQALASGIERVAGDKGRGKGRGDLRQCQGPDDPLLVSRIAERPAGDPCGNPFADEKGGNNAGDQRKVVDNVEDEGDRVDQKAGGDEEDRNEQRLAEELQFDAGGLVARRGVDRELSEENWRWWSSGLWKNKRFQHSPTSDPA